jgi:2-phospho-L-lactate guanylyltransferase
MILVPVKNLAYAKQRLASVMHQAARTQLAEAMLFDVLETVARWDKRPEVGVVTNDRFALELAEHFSLEIIPDPASRSETEAIEMATRVCEARGADNTLVIPGDIPLIQTSELETIFSSAPEQGSVLVPAADGRGTNAALRRPAGLFPLRFGNDSFQPHLEAARASQRPCVVLSLRGIALDIDTPADLRELGEAPGATRAQQIARRLGLVELPPAANE